MQLIKLRETAGKSQKLVAADLEISVSTINRHEQGKAPLTPKYRALYALYYGVKPDSIEQPDRHAKKKTRSTRKGQRAA